LFDFWGIRQGEAAIKEGRVESPLSRAHPWRHASAAHPSRSHR
jgi:hypothetical protein